jgi:hypothetical protein
MKVRACRWIAMSLLVLSASFAAPVLADPWPPFDPSNCPQNYAPVICSDGLIYGNSCEAESYGATGCVPWSDF